MIIFIHIIQNYINITFNVHIAARHIGRASPISSLLFSTLASLQLLLWVHTMTLTC